MQNFYLTCVIGIPFWLRNNPKEGIETLSKSAEWAKLFFVTSTKIAPWMEEVIFETCGINEARPSLREKGFAK